MGCGYGYNIVDQAIGLSKWISCHRIPSEDATNSTQYSAMLLKKSTSQVCRSNQPIERYIERELMKLLMLIYIYTHIGYPFVLFNPCDNHFVSLSDSVFFRLRHASLRRRFSATEKSHVRFQEICKRFDKREIDAHVVKKLDDLFGVIRSFEKIVRVRDIESPIQYQ